MAQLSTKPPERSPGPVRRREPSVLVVLVVRNGARWLRRCLLALSQQTHPRLGVVAVDNASTDGSREILDQALGSQRVLRLDENAGLPGAVQAALQLDAAERADYILVLHDDCAPEQETVARLVEAAERIEGAGVVGPKIVDWDDARVLREIGLSSDRFGYPYSSLEEGELDQGQYDRLREVLYVSSAAMLVSRDAWLRAGVPDERLAPYHDDLDFCWRARLAGFRVLFSPSARVRHRAATVAGERDAAELRRGRYHVERATLAAILKNYGLPSLLWVLPLYLVQGLAKAVVLVAQRRLGEAFQVLRAWGWNLLHLPGTVRRRARAQAVRTVPDRAIRRYMAPATIRLRRWVEARTQSARGRVDSDSPEVRLEDQEDLVLPSLGARTFSAARSHPVAAAWVAAALVCLWAYRGLWGPGPLQGGAIPAFPGGSGAFFHELASGFRTTGLGGEQAASPALAALGALSVVARSTDLALKLLLGLLPLVAAITMYRFLLRLTARSGAAVVGAASYGLSSAATWAFSQGRLALLVSLATLPVLAERIRDSFAPNPPRRRFAFVVEGGVVLAVAVAFLPGTLLAVALLVIAHAVVPDRGGRARRGALLLLCITLMAAALVLPLAIDLVAGGGAGLGSTAGRPDLSALLRLAPGGGTGSWAVGWFLPAAALLSFVMLGEEHSRAGLRYLLCATSFPFLAWAAAAGYLPSQLSNPSAYVVVGALALSTLVALGVTSAFPLARHAFGYRQIGGLALAAILGGGLFLQAALAATAPWDIGRNKLTGAWPIVSTSSPKGDFRVLWLGSDTREPFPSPGGDPLGEMRAGDSSVRFGLTGRAGSTALDIGRAAYGDGYARLRLALAEVLSGDTRHGGALLAPFGIRFVVAGEGDLPGAAARALESQLDLNEVSAGGLHIFRNSRALPLAFVAFGPEYTKAASTGSLSDTARLAWTGVHPMTPTAGGFTASDVMGPGPAVAVLEYQYGKGWAVDSRGGAGGELSEADPAFGWATGRRVFSGEVDDRIFFRHQYVRTVELWLLAGVWIAALWFTRKPARR
jgi:GT2 family glycosyltransferase